MQRRCPRGERSNETISQVYPTLQGRDSPVTAEQAEGPAGSTVRTPGLGAASPGRLLRGLARGTGQPGLSCPRRCGPGASAIGGLARGSRTRQSATPPISDLPAFAVGVRGFHPQIDDFTFLPVQRGRAPRSGRGRGMRGNASPERGVTPSTPCALWGLAVRMPALFIRGLGVPPQIDDFPLIPACVGGHCAAVAGRG
jgi:hypothetical protein